MSSIVIRTATPDDIDQLMALEMNWSEGARASVETIITRLEKFSQGFFVAEQDGKLIANIAGCPHRYEPKNLSNMQCWADVTNGGVYHDCENLAAYNSLYVVSGVIDKACRGSTLILDGISHVIALARQLGYDYVVAGAVISGYARYCEKYGNIPAAEYVFKHRDKNYIDSLLASYQKLGFSVPDEQHVIADYYPDAGSMNYAALVVKKLS